MSFQPSIKNIVKILCILKAHPVGKTELTDLTKSHHARVAKHIKWLEAKEMIKPVIEGSKIKFEITDLGRAFLETISK